jgi:hypothetical protein
MVKENTSFLGNRVSDANTAIYFCKGNVRKQNECAHLDTPPKLVAQPSWLRKKRLTFSGQPL